MSIMHEYEGDGRHRAIRNEMVSFGEKLMRAGHMEAAQQVFCRLVQIYPESAAAYASLGEFYLKTGDRDLAKKNFARALELCPENPGSPAPDVGHEESLLSSRSSNRDG